MILGSSDPRVLGAGVPAHSVQASQAGTSRPAALATGEVFRCVRDAGDIETARLLLRQKVDGCLVHNNNKCPAALGVLDT